MTAVTVENAVCRFDTVIETYLADRYDRLKISSLMRLFQEAGEKHITAEGSPSSLLCEKYNAAYVISRSSIKIHSLPHGGDTVTVSTWCSGISGARLLRNYSLCGKDGTLLAEAKSEFTLIDLEKRKIIRPGNIPEIARAGYTSAPENGCPDVEKLCFSADDGTETERKIVYSDIDRNGHLNNTVYYDIMYDLLPEEYTAKLPGHIAINFTGEAYIGETLTVKTAVSQDAARFCGTVGGRNCFCGRITF